MYKLILAEKEVKYILQLLDADLKTRGLEGLVDVVNLHNILMAALEPIKDNEITERDLAGYTEGEGGV